MDADLERLHSEFGKGNAIDYKILYNHSIIIQTTD